jgi:dTDP-4-dehydrorhamnose reductase
MRLLITGASGELGGPLLQTAQQTRGIKAIGTTFSQVVPGAVQVDLRDEVMTIALIGQARPDAIIHTALSERSPNFEEAIPEVGELLATITRREGIRLVAMSTDMVFDGEAPPYSIEDRPTGRSAYGRAKAAMEERILAENPQAAIVRTSLLYDFHAENRQISWMVEKVEAGEPVRLFTDEIRQPIWVWDLARALTTLCENDRVGILHVAGPEALSRYDYGLALLEATGLRARATIEAVRAAEVAPQRPRDVTMVLSKVPTPIRTVGEAAAASGPSDLDHD